MATTRNMLSDWFDREKKEGNTHMIVVCDSFDWEDYPVGVSSSEDVREIEDKYRGKEMQRVMEVYDLSKDKDEQLSQGRVFNY